jgi:phosphoglycerate dehydrogenase-like enzyme
MKKHLVIILPDLTENHRASICAAAGRQGFDCRFFDEPSQSLPFLQDAEIIVGTDPFLSRNAPNLRWLCSPFAGVDPFLADDAFAAPSALLTCSSGAYGVTISEHVIMLLLEILRRRPEYRAHTDRREWVRRLPVRAIFDSRITLLGTGDIGQETLRRLRAFAPKQILGINRRGLNPGGLFDRIVQRDHLDEILPETDILIISLPGTRDTFRIISEKQLKLLPDDAVIINVGRGSVIDQQALEAELRSGRLYAGLDVFEAEPVPPDASIWTCPRLIMTSHVAGDTTLPHTVDRIVELFLGDFENYCAGRPLTQLVDRQIGY